MGEELLLGGPRVLPKVAEVEGFKFRFPTLPEALEDIF
jgi:NAD dependent epimerase/dehydratase family enzyme